MPHVKRSNMFLATSPPSHQLLSLDNSPMPPPPPQILSSRKPESYIKTTCKECLTPIEFLPATPAPNAKLLVECWACKKVFECELDAQGKSVRGTEKMDKKISRRIGSDENPISTEYYDLLGVAPTADSLEIKKKYRQLAIKFHPDKNPDPDAEEQFKRISEAYQVLSDPDLRKKYNEFGPQNNLAPEGGFVNPEDFFKSQFGGDRFTDIIGEISIGRDMKEAMQGVDTSEEDANLTEEEKAKRELQKQQGERERLDARARRVETLAANLTRKLNLYTEAPEAPASANAFQNIIQIEAEELKAESYGVELLHAVGYTYSLKSKQHLARYESMFGLTGYWHSMREKSHIIGETVSTLRSAIDLQNSFTQLQEAEKRGGMTEEEKTRLEETAAQKGLQAIWRGSKLEVEGVLRDVCDRVLSDPKITKEVQRRRAMGLKIIGSVYESVRLDSVLEDVPIDNPINSEVGRQSLGGNTAWPREKAARQDNSVSKDAKDTRRRTTGFN